MRLNACKESANISILLFCSCQNKRQLDRHICSIYQCVYSPVFHADLFRQQFTMVLCVGVGQQPSTLRQQSSHAVQFAVSCLFLWHFTALARPWPDIFSECLSIRHLLSASAGQHCSYRCPWPPNLYVINLIPAQWASSGNKQHGEFNIAVVIRAGSWGRGKVVCHV